MSVYRISVKKMNLNKNEHQTKKIIKKKKQKKMHASSIQIPLTKIFTIFLLESFEQKPNVLYMDDALLDAIQLHNINLNSYPVFQTTYIEFLESVLQGI